MDSSVSTATSPVDSPETRRYNRIRRRLGVLDFVLGLLLLVVLLTTGWNGSLRDLAYRASLQFYTLAVFFYVLALLVIGKVLGFGLDYYGFRLEHSFNLSNQKFRPWLWDEAKGLIVSVVLASLVAELLYFIIR